MTVSLVLATITRVAVVSRFLNSLQDQNAAHIQVVVVDQNEDNRLRGVLADAPSSLDIVHMTSSRGLSVARNAGLMTTTGDVIGFPDDDCWYFPDTVERVVKFFADHPAVGGLTGTCVDENEKMSNVGRFDPEAGWIDRNNVWRRCVAPAMFFRHDLVGITGGFDETLGVGASTPWKSGEETDYLLRAIKRGFNVWYDPTFVVGHANPVFRHDKEAQKRALNYGRGMGRVLRKHHYSDWFVAWTMIRPLGGTILSIGALRWKKAQYHWNVFRGRLEGWLDRSPFS